MKPQFSILVPTYNQADFLKEALDSLLAQSVQDWEAVVVDDGSTDHTAEVLKQYTALDPRIRAFTQQNGGTAAALNTALSQARGTWICWLSSDDLFTPDKLAVHQRWFTLCPDCKFFFTYFRLRIEATGQTFNQHGLWGPLPQRRYQALGLLVRNFISGISVCIHREVFDKLGGFSQELRYGQDYDRWLWISSQYPGVFIPEWTCISRNHAGQGSEVFPQACYYDTARAAVRFLSRVSLPDMVPLCDLSRPDTAVDVLNEALRIALEADAFLYWFGATPALFFNCFKWIAHYPDETVRSALWQMAEERLTGAAGALPESAFAHMVRVMLLAAVSRTPAAAETEVNPAWAGQQLYCDLTLAGDPRKQALEKYFCEFMHTELFPPDLNIAGLSVAVACGPEELAWVQQRAQNWVRQGADVLILCEGAAELAYRQGVYILRCSFQHLLDRNLPGSFTVGLHTCTTTLPVQAQQVHVFNRNFNLSEHSRRCSQKLSLKRLRKRLDFRRIINHFIGT